MISASQFPAGHAQYPELQVYARIYGGLLMYIANECAYANSLQDFDRIQAQNEVVM